MKTVLLAVAVFSWSFACAQEAKAPTKRAVPALAESRALAAARELTRQLEAQRKNQKEPAPPRPSFDAELRREQGQFEQQRALQKSEPSRPSHFGSVYVCYKAGRRIVSSAPCDQVK